MDLKQIIDFIPSDQTIGGIIQTIKTDYAIIASAALILLGNPILWVLKKIAKLTPWKSDDALFDSMQDRIDKLEGRLGVKHER